MIKVSDYFLARVEREYIRIGFMFVYCVYVSVDENIEIIGKGLNILIECFFF